MKLEWTRLARDRLGHIHDIIAADAPERAIHFCETLVSASEELPAFPYVGSLLPEDAAYRQLVVSRYRLVYRIASNVIYVVTVVPPRMLLNPEELGRDDLSASQAPNR